MSQKTIFKIKEYLGSNSIAVITVADHEIEHSINQIMIETETPAIYASVNSGVEMARVFRVIPNKTPCYDCVVTLTPNCNDQESLMYSFPCQEEDTIMAMKEHVNISVKRKHCQQSLGALMKMLKIISSH